MVRNKETKVADETTEERIKNAARIVFYKKGYAGTRTRDIAEEADINLALLNYYFRSKKKLFDIIMIEAVSRFMQNMSVVLNDEKSTLGQKIESIAENYVDFIIEEPNIPIFVLSEIRNNADGLLEKLPVKYLVINSTFFKQYQKAVTEEEITEPNPLHFLMNLWGLIIFPFIGKPLLNGAINTTDAEFNKLMRERKSLIPIWINAIMKAK